MKSLEFTLRATWQHIQKTGGEDHPDGPASHDWAGVESALVRSVA